MKTYTILENGIDYTITKEQRDILVKNRIIYHCPDCGEVFYHREPNISEDRFTKTVDELIKTVGKSLI